MLQNPPAYNPEPNGACEKAVQDVAAQTRALKIGLESRLREPISDESPVIEWIIPHAAYLLTRFQVAHDGMTPFERLTGRKWRRPLVEFGEVVFAKLALKKVAKGSKKRHKRKLAPRAVLGTWVGQIGRTGEHIVIKQSGDAIRCRTIRRVPIQDRWNADMVKSIAATPRVPVPSKPEDEDIGNIVVDEEAKLDPTKRQNARKKEPSAEPAGPSGADLELPDVRRAERDIDIRKLRITGRVLSQYGYSDHCEGCSRKAEGNTDHRNHSEACRTRIMNEMIQDVGDRRKVESQEKRMQRKADLVDERTHEKTKEPNTDDTRNSAKTEPAKAMPGDVDVNDFTADELQTMLNELMPPVQARRTPSPFKGEGRNRLHAIPEEDEEVDAGSEPSDHSDEDGQGIPMLDEDVVTREDEAVSWLIEEDDPMGSGARSRVPTDEAAVPKPLAQDSMPKRDRDGVGLQEDLEEEDDGEPWAKRSRAALITSVGRSMAREEDDRDRQHQMLACLNSLAAVRSRSDVQQILKELDAKKEFALPKNRRQRRTAARDRTNDVSEVYSPPRVSETAGEMGLRPGWALDLTTTDPDDGRPWDFNEPEKRKKAMDKVKNDRPFMLIASPMCGPLSALQALFNSSTTRTCPRQRCGTNSTRPSTT